MKQITILCKQDSNPLTEVAELLGNHNVDIRDINYQQIGEQPFLNLITNDNDQSLALLTGAGYLAIADETLLLQQDDRPGALAAISRSVTDAGIQIRSLTLVVQESSHTVVAISTSDNAKVRELFSGRVLN